MPAGAATRDDVCGLGAAELGRLYRNRDLSPVEVVRCTCDRIERLAPALNAYITVLRESAIAAAKAMEMQFAAGIDLGPLHGVPVSVKDVIAMRHTRTTAASRVLESAPVDTQDAQVVRRLRAGGAVIVGKTNLSEFCVAGNDPDGPFGTVQNPRRIGYQTGGSSSGAAAAVAAGLAVLSLGTDCGGSIRLPASFCGVAGLKPTYDLLSMDGVLTSSRTLDHVGPLARSVADIAAGLAVLVGSDAVDGPEVTVSASSHVGYLDALASRVDGLRFGVPSHPYYAFGDAANQERVARARDVLAGLGLRPVPLEIPHAEEATEATEAILSGDHYAYHEARIQAGAPYGKDFFEQVKRWRRVTVAEYARARDLQVIIRREWLALFDRVDVVVFPANAAVAPPEGMDMIEIGGRRESVRQANGRFNRVSDLTGFPALTVPIGESVEGLPVGIQLIGPPRGESRLLAVGYALEQACGNLPASWGIEPRGVP